MLRHEASTIRLLELLADVSQAQHDTLFLPYPILIGRGNSLVTTHSCYRAKNRVFPLAKWYPNPMNLKHLLCLMLLLTLNATSHAAPVPAPQQVILDTDIGDDIDDAYAVVLLTALPNAQLLGVTTTYGATRERAELTAKLLHRLGRDDVLVYAGDEAQQALARSINGRMGFRRRP